MLLLCGIVVVLDTVRCHGGSSSPLGQRPGEVDSRVGFLEGLELPKTALGLCFCLSPYISRVFDPVEGAGCPSRSPFWPHLRITLAGTNVDPGIYEPSRPCAGVGHHGYPRRRGIGNGRATPALWGDGYRRFLLGTVPSGGATIEYGVQARGLVAEVLTDVNRRKCHFRQRQLAVNPSTGAALQATPTLGQRPSSISGIPWGIVRYAKCCLRSFGSMSACC